MGKTYRVIKYTAKKSFDCGNLDESDVKRMLKGYKFDENLKMWFSPKGVVGYEVLLVDWDKR